MKRDFETILDESLSRLKQKESIEACLRRYPQYAVQLEPLLRTALKVEILKDITPPSVKVMAAGRERFLREAGRLRAERVPAHKPAKGPARRRRLMLSMAAATLIALLLALAALAGFEASDTLRRLYHWWGTLVPQPTMTLPTTDTPWPIMTPHEYQTPTATRTLYPVESDTPTCTPTATPTCTPTFTSEEPTHRPILPTHAPTATPTPEPTDTPVPTATPVPPTYTPHPTEEHGGGHDDDHGGSGRDDDDHGSGGHDNDDHGSGGHDGGDHSGGDHDGGGYRDQY
jgi:hypothetical protein